ncbi:MAG: stage IV sporulation protein A, partial [Clostridia bacterium]
MESRTIYEDIALRTDGEIYIGVVGPVRTGKSTFIKRFMEALVIPNIDNVYRKERARDELPQSGSGRTIMTAEPKFVPEEAVSITLGDKADLKVRMIDCVGYMVPGALGVTESGEPRMVSTPWYDKEIPMTEAAEIGTRKVIAEHSTIGLVVTTDGSATDIAREDYIEAEQRVISELSEIGKPFMILLNSAHPQNAETIALARELSEKHNVTCMPVNCLTVNEDEITEIIRGVLYEFPMTELNIYLPSWVDTLPQNHQIKTELYSAMLIGAGKMHKIRDINVCMDELRSCPSITEIEMRGVNLGKGVAGADVMLPRE